MESTTVARSLRGSIGMLAMEWLVHPTTFEKSADRGMPGSMAAYAVGRWGVLGDCPVEAVSEAAYFWNPTLVATLVAEGRALIAPADGGRIWADICAEWGADRLTDFGGAERLGELLAAVVASADGTTAPLFVGWRDEIDDDPGPGRTFQLAQTMRELRFSRHCEAVRASGLSPLEAILAGPAPGSAQMFGWSEPFPDVAELADRREQVETDTDRLHGVDLDVLSAGERAQLRDLTKAARLHVSRP